LFCLVNFTSISRIFTRLSFGKCDLLFLFACSELDFELASFFNERLTEGTTRDGMDRVFCTFNPSQMKGSFCGAGRPIILIRDCEFVEFKKGKDSIGHASKETKEFETIHFGLQEGDQFYLFSDGDTDQFGGET